MRKRTWFAALLALSGLLLCLAGCGGVQESAAAEDAVLSFDSFDGGGPEYTVLVDDPTVVDYACKRVYANPNHAKMDGSFYTVRFTFTGRKAGQTTVTVQARSPIADAFDAVYAVTVDKALHVSIQEISRTDLNGFADEVVEEPVE